MSTFYSYYPYSGLVNALTSLSLGLFVFFRNRRSKANVSFLFFTFSVSLWGFNYFLWLLSADSPEALFFIRNAMAGAALIPAAYWYFIENLLGFKNRVWRYANFLLAFVFVAFSHSPSYIRGVEPRMFFDFWPVPGPLFHLMLAYFIAHVLCVSVVLWSKERAASGVRKVQLKYVLAGTLIGYCGGCTNYFLWYRIPVPPVLNILVSVYVFCVGYAIVRHKLMNIDVIVKKTLVFAGLFAAAYGVFASFAYVGSAVFENIMPNRWVAMAPSVLIIVIMLRPLETFLRNATDRYLFQKTYDYKHLLKTFSDEVLTVLDMNQLVNLTVNKLVDVIKLENSSILLRDKSGERFFVAAAFGAGKLAPRLLSGEYFIRLLEETGKHALLNEGGSPEQQKAIAARMRDLRAVLVIPLMHHTELTGMLCLGKKKSDEDFTQDDIDILLPLARTLSIAIANARLFEQLAESQARAAQREKMAVIGTLSAGINHEICNPLGIARGQCEMFLLNLREGIYAGKSPEELLEKAKDIMQKVINETDRATVITRKLSSFAKPSFGDIEDSVDINEELEEVISLVEHDLRLDNIELKRNIQPGIPAIRADRKQVQEIFFNIIRNASQSIEGKGSVVINAFVESGKVVVEISDTGSGISETDMGQIFNPFFTTKEPGKGTGLGLFIVKQLVEKNGGRISVQSKPGRGTAVTLVFSVYAGSVREEPGARASTGRAA